MTTQQKIDNLVQYLKMKVEEKDWHGVSDAANDIRVLEAKLTIVTPEVVNPYSPGSFEHFMWNEGASNDVKA